MTNANDPANPLMPHIINGQFQGLTKREFFAAKAMTSATSETADTVPASFWDWVKMLLVQICHLTFLKVKYRDIKGAHEAAAKRATKYADALINELNK